MNKDNLFPGHLACAGCGEVLALKLVLQAIGEDAIAVVIPSCLGIIIGPFPYAALGIPVYHTAFETAAASAAGISNALLARGDTKTTVIALAGDGGTCDIGFQSLSGCADRNENLIYCCFDNEAYMNTGIQMSSSTPQGAWTTTTPLGKSLQKKNMMEIMAAHRIPYVASACACFPEDLKQKVRTAREMQGLKYIHILSPCPTGWKFPERLMPNVGRLAVETCAWPLYEVRDGVNYRITYDSKLLPLSEYFSLQGRFKHLARQDLAEIEIKIKENWEEVKKRSERNLTI